jgi:hypothetical protein
MRRLGLLASGALFVGALGYSWLTHGTGVIRNDPERHISVPAALTVPLRVQVAHNGTDVLFRYRWPSPNPGIHHDMLRFDGTAWQVRGRAAPGPAGDGLHEDRVAMMLDDGSVPEFGRYGGYIAIGNRLAGMTDEISGRDVAAHPELRRLGQDEPTKYLPATRQNPAEFLSVAPEAEQRRLQAAGYFLDLWHWRAARSNPAGVADDQFVAAARISDAGRGMYTTNWDGPNRRPARMFDPAQNSGRAAFRWEDLTQGRIGQDAVNALTAENSVPFDPNHAWREGDTIPRRVLRAPQGSRGDIGVAGRARWANGEWDVTLRRRMDTGNSQDDKIIRDGGVYQAAFAIHRQATGGRWHYVSLPLSVGFGRPADVQAARFEGEAPDWSQAAHNVTLFYPGQVNWPLIMSERHAGADRVRAGVPVRFRHTEDQLAHYGIEMEFNEAIRNQWRLTMLAGLALIAGFGIALTGTIGRGKGA